MSGFIEMVEASMKGKERSFTQPPSEEKPPKICPLPNGYCPITACPQRNNPDQHGEECWYYTEANKSTVMPDPTKPPITPSIEKMVEKAFEPFERRLRQIEDQEKTSTIERSLPIQPNGQHRKRVDLGTNSERINND